MRGKIHLVLNCKNEFNRPRITLEREHIKSELVGKRKIEFKRPRMAWEMGHTQF